MSFYWQTKTFRTREEMEEWIEENKRFYQIKEIFVNNRFAVDYKDLIKLLDDEEF